MEWYIEKKKKEKEAKEAERKEEERIERLNKAKEKKKKLLEKIGKRNMIVKSPMQKDKIWLEKKKESWRRYRENTEMKKEEEIEIYNKLVDTNKSTKGRKERKR